MIRGCSALLHYFLKKFVTQSSFWLCTKPWYQVGCKQFQNFLKKLFCKTHATYLILQKYTREVAKPESHNTGDALVPLCTSLLKNVVRFLFIARSCQRYLVIVIAKWLIKIYNIHSLKFRQWMSSIEGCRIRSILFNCPLKKRSPLQR